MGDIKRKQRPEPATAPGLADESVNASRRAGPEPDPGREHPLDRAKVATHAPGVRATREGPERS